MGKKRRNRATTKNGHPIGWLEGYPDFRYGEKRPVYRPGRALSAMLTVAQRDVVIERIAQILGTWKATKFEHEASCRHGLRQAMCMEGHLWAPSDALAAEIVAAALNKIGATRPSWLDGQPDVADVTQHCLHCGNELEERQLQRLDKFCGPSCARSHLQKREGSWSRESSATAHAARKVAALSLNKQSSCECCGKSFVPRGHYRKEGMSKYCSQECFGIAIRTIEERACACCGETFRPKHDATQKYCSVKCRAQAYSDAPPARHCKCAVCGSTFGAKDPRATFCSPRCKNAHSKWRSRPPSKLSPLVFDHYVMLPLSRFPPPLIPARFDSAFQMAS